MDLSSFAKTTEIIQHLTVALASIAGGIWAILRVNRERTYERALKIEINTNTIAATQPLIFVRVTLTNQGHSMLQANEGAANSPVYSDPVDKIYYSCSLQIRKFDAGQAKPDLSVDWYDIGLLSAAVPDINLLSDYQNPNNGKFEFWMEPGESYHLGSLLCLRSGLYLGRVIFIGPDSGEDFWSETFYFQIPADLEDRRPVSDKQ